MIFLFCNTIFDAEYRISPIIASSYNLKRLLVGSGTIMRMFNEG